MAEIALTRNMSALVDDEDYEHLANFRWFAVKDNRKHTFYAIRHVWIDGRRTTHRMHREVLGLEVGGGGTVDHKDRDGLNNQKDNLRIVSNSLSSYNCRHKNSNTSGYRGVWRHGKGWEAAIGLHGKSFYLGSFSNPEDAAMAYDRGALRYYGKDAKLNFPGGNNV
jgi:hypothetical protein